MEILLINLIIQIFIFIGFIGDFVMSNKKTNLFIHFWRREPESNRPTWICNPVHNRFAITPEMLERETSLELATSTLARLRSTN